MTSQSSTTLSRQKPDDVLDTLLPCHLRALARTSKTDATSARTPSPASSLPRVQQHPRPPPQSVLPQASLAMFPFKTRICYIISPLLMWPGATSTSLSLCSLATWNSFTASMSKTF